MFLIIKGINTLKKKEAQSDADISSTDKLLTEIRDLLKK
jgi:large-conductance mechanosensitive channel